MTTDVTIRRPQQFKPGRGENLNWYVIDTLTSDTLQRGEVAIYKDDLVVIPGVKVYKETIRKVYIEVRTVLATSKTVQTERAVAQK
ncbi:MAG: hypothetical protein WKG06_26560 [Segetibacter sp.]